MQVPFDRAACLVILKAKFTKDELAKECAYQAQHGGVDVFDDRTLRAMIENLIQDRRIASRAKKETA